MKSSLAFSQHLQSSCSVMSLRLQALSIFLLMLSVTVFPSWYQNSCLSSKHHILKQQSQKASKQEGLKAFLHVALFLFSESSPANFFLLSQWPQLCHLCPLNQSLQKRNGYFHWISTLTICFLGLGGDPLSLSILAPNRWTKLDFC